MKMIIIMIMMIIMMMMILDLFHFVTESRAESISSARATSFPRSEKYFDRSFYFLLITLKIKGKGWGPQGGPRGWSPIVASRNPGIC